MRVTRLRGVQPSASDNVLPAGSTLAGRIDRWVEPTDENLPNRRVVLAFPAVLLAILAILVALGITGSSTGYLHQFFSLDKDPALISGQPQGIRSDEWNVQTALVISQVEQGLPIVNENFPGGIDSTVQSDLPSLDWSMAFRPHLVGFLVLPLDNAAALRWWLPGLALIAACYLFFVTMSPRRPVTAAAMSVGFFFAPFFQWWYLPVTFWPAVWCLLTITAAVWLLRGRRRGPKIVLSALAGYTAVTTAIGVYVPFMIPALLLAVTFVIGLVFGTQDRVRVTGVVARLRALLPLLAAGVGAVVVVGVWCLTRLETLERFLGTIYPGQRLVETGSVTSEGLVSIFAAPFTRTLGKPGIEAIYMNSSETSSFLLVGYFLLVPLLWFTWRTWRSRRAVDWLTVSLTVLTLVIAAFLLMPGWDAVAHLLLLDRTTEARIVFGIGLLGIVLVAVFCARSDAESADQPRRAPLLVALAAASLAALSIVIVAVVLYADDASLVLGTRTWIPICLAVVLTVYLFARAHLLLGAGGFLAVSVLVASGVNPVYAGVYDLNDTELMHYMKSMDDAEEVDWLGVGFLPSSVLVHSGLHSYNGFQSAPPPEMWEQIDPADRYERQWNRLGHVSWVVGEGAPRPVNSQVDTIIMNFDSCADFAQRHVEYVLSDVAIDQPCVQPVTSIRQGPTEFFIYEVEPEPVP